MHVEWLLHTAATIDSNEYYPIQMRPLISRTAIEYYKQEPAPTMAIGRNRCMDSDICRGKERKQEK